MSQISHRFLRGRTIVYATVLALAAASGASAFAWAHGGGNAQAMTLDPTANPADLADHVAQMSAHIYAKVGATDAQKAQLDPIFAQAASDLAAIHAQFGSSSHDQALELLAQNPVDRAALEAFRVDHMRLADEASRRMTQLLADVADVLTPAQRRLFVDGIKEHHAGHMGMGFHGG